MHSATISTSKHLGSLELTRTLLQQQTMTSLLASLTRCVQREGIADAMTLVLFNSDSERVSFHGIDADCQPVYYEDETLLSTGPVHTLLDNPQIQVWQSEALRSSYPQLAALNLYPPFAHYCLVPLQLPAGLRGGCEFTRQQSRPFSDEDQHRLNERCRLVAIAVEQVQLRN